MRKYVAPELFEYYNNETSFESTDKELAVIVYEYAKTKAKKDFADIGKDVVSELEEDIKRIKKEIKEDDESKK